MIYSDFPDETALRQLCAAMNARARRLGHDTPLTPIELRGVILESGGRCAWCDADLRGQPLHVDHVISLSQGGAHTPGNLACACPDCNRRKSNKHPARFVQEVAARTGVLTAWGRRVLDHYGVDDPPPTQPGLFD